MIRWRGRDLREKEQVANAWDSFVDLTPVSEIPAEQVRTNFDPLRAGQEIPLIGEDQDGYRPEKDDPDEFWHRFG